jgi:hypothetical protein
MIEVKPEGYQAMRDAGFTSPRFLYFEAFFRGPNAHIPTLIDPRAMPELTLKVEKLVEAEYNGGTSAVHTEIGTTDYDAMVRVQGPSYSLANIRMFAIGDKYYALMMDAHLSVTNENLAHARNIMAGLEELLEGYHIGGGDGAIVLKNHGRPENNGYGVLVNLGMHREVPLRMDLPPDGSLW